MTRKGRAKPNVSGERYNSNAVDIPMMNESMVPAPMMPVAPMASHTELPEECRRWNILYPNYLDSSKSIPQGRRIAKEKCCDKPTVIEMAAVCRHLKIPHVVEMNKFYSREWFIPGRVRVQLKTETGSYCHDTIHTKKDLMENMGKTIPLLQIRKERLEKEASDALKATQTTKASGSSGKKKGKKKGRR